jgi:hypothetical protein
VEICVDFQPAIGIDQHVFDACQTHDITSVDPEEVVGRQDFLQGLQLVVGNESPPIFPQMIGVLALITLKTLTVVFKIKLIAKITFSPTGIQLVQEEAFPKAQHIETHPFFTGKVRGF